MKDIIIHIDNRPGASVQFEYLPLKKVMQKIYENVTVTVSNAFGEMINDKVLR